MNLSKGGKMVEKQRGGARIGAGRKPGAEGPSIVVSVSIPSELMARVDSVAAAKEWSRSAAMTEAVRLLLKRHEPKG
jgi:hypothetical protein